jgi:hypothetical protein
MSWDDLCLCMVMPDLAIPASGSGGTGSGHVFFWAELSNGCRVTGGGWRKGWRVGGAVTL